MPRAQDPLSELYELPRQPQVLLLRAIDVLHHALQAGLVAELRDRRHGMSQGVGVLSPGHLDIALSQRQFACYGVELAGELLASAPRLRVRGRASEPKPMRRCRG